MQPAPWQRLLAATPPWVDVAVGLEDGVRRLTAALRERGIHVYELDLSGAADKAALMDALAGAMAFPSYFGRNWDAVLDCLRDLPEPPPGGGYVLLVSGADTLAERDPAAWETLLAVFGVAGAYWAEAGRAFHVVVVGDGPAEEAVRDGPAEEWDALTLPSG